jgi:Helix-turn-helix domain
VTTGSRYFLTETKWAYVVCLSHRPSNLCGMQLRYRYRLDPTLAQRQALARAFGCARAVYNDGLRLREDAYRTGLPFVGGVELSRRVVTLAKQTPQRAWLGEVSAVALQQSLADLDQRLPQLLPGPATGQGCEGTRRASEAAGSQASVQVPPSCAGGQVHPE